TCGSIFTAERNCSPPCTMRWPTASASARGESSAAASAGCSIWAPSSASSCWARMTSSSSSSRSLRLLEPAVTVRTRTARASWPTDPTAYAWLDGSTSAPGFMMFKNVLVGVDGTANARDAIALACQLREGDGQLTLVHVHGGGLGLSRPDTPGRLEEERQR